MSTSSSILAWRIPWTEVGLSPCASKRVGHDLATKQEQSQPKPLLNVCKTGKTSECPPWSFPFPDLE